MLNNPNLDGKLAQLINAYKTNTNPMFLFDENTRNLMQCFKGNDMQQVFYNLCQYKGVNPQDILNLFKK